MTSILEVIKGGDRIIYERKHGPPGLPDLHLVFLDGRRLMLTKDMEEAAEFFRTLTLMGEILAQI